MIRVRTIAERAELAVLRAARARLWTDEEWNSADAYQSATSPCGPVRWSARYRTWKATRNGVPVTISRGVPIGVGCIASGPISGEVDADEPAPSPLPRKPPQDPQGAGP